MSIDEEVANKLENISDALAQVERSLLQFRACLDSVINAKQAHGSQVGALDERVTALEEQMAKHLSGLYPAVDPAG